jgi:hypothetical protein
MRLEELHRISRAVGEAAKMETGDLTNCILASGALMDLLRKLDVDARCVRAEVAVSPRTGERHAYILGSLGDGSRRPAAEPGMWNGHLVVVAGDVLLDPTLDQIAAAAEEDGRDGYDYLCAFAAPITDTPRSARGGMWFTLDDVGIGTPIPTWHGSDVRYNICPEMGGWKNAPLFRPRVRARVAGIAEALLLSGVRQ